MLALGPSAAAHAHTAYNFDFPFGAPQLAAPDALAVDPGDGEVFVADGGRIVAFAATGTPSRSFGQASGALGVSPVPPYDVYSYDPRAGAIERYSNDGAPLGGWPVAGARGIAFDPQGNVFVAADHGVTRFSATGGAATPVATTAFTSLGASPAALFGVDAATNLAEQLAFDGTPGQRFGAGRLDAPHAIAADGDGAVLVADSGHERVAILNADGSLAASFGSRGSGEGQFQMPSGIGWSPFNQHVYVSDTVNANVTAWKPIPPPVLGQMDIQTDAGVVYFQRPGSGRFAKLTAVTRVPSGTIIDARGGTVGITSRTATGQLQSADFYKGVFRALQPPAARGLTDAQLVGGDFGHCPAGLRAAKNPQTIRRLWGSGAGRFRTEGRFATASIRGTTWLTDDRCDGTLIRVTEGAVSVRDLVAKKTVFLAAGRQYFARAR